MILEALRPAERRLLLPGFQTVIWEDDADFANYTQKALQSACNELSLNNGSIHLGLSPIEAFYKTLNADGQPADLVLLDNRLTEKSWRIDAEKLYSELALIAQQSGLDITAFKPRCDYYGMMPNDLYSLNGINVAILLRLIGYKNNIFFVTSDPPSVNAIISEMQRLNEAIPQYQPKSIPANGYVMKDNLGRNQLSFWANSVSPELQWDDSEHYTRSLPAALAKLLA